MPQAPRGAVRSGAVAPQRFCPGSTASDRLGRSKLAMNIRGSPAPAACRCRGAPPCPAVAVRAIAGTSGNFSFSRCSCPYSAEVVPQLLTQCASSMAIGDSGRCGGVWKNEGTEHGLGRDVQQLQASVGELLLHGAFLLRRRLLFRYAAAMPLACNACTWSFIRAIGARSPGVRPSSANAGTW